MLNESTQVHTLRSEHIDYNDLPFVVRVVLISISSQRWHIQDVWYVILLYSKCDHSLLVAVDRDAFPNRAALHLEEEDVSVPVNVGKWNGPGKVINVRIENEGYLIDIQWVCLLCYFLFKFNQGLLQGPKTLLRLNKVNVNDALVQKNQGMWETIERDVFPHQYV